MKKNIQLLLVDDDASVTQALFRIFRDYTRKSFVDSVKALKSLDEYDYDVAVIDLHMPQLNGLQLVRAIKQKAKETEVLVLSGLNTKKIVLQAIKEGAREVIPKPCDAETLLGIIENIIEEKSEEFVFSHTDKNELIDMTSLNSVDINNSNNELLSGIYEIEKVNSEKTVKKSFSEKSVFVKVDIGDLEDYIDDISHELLYEKINEEFYSPVKELKKKHGLSFLKIHNGIIFISSLGEKSLARVYNFIMDLKKINSSLDMKVLVDYSKVIYGIQGIRKEYTSLNIYSENSIEFDRIDKLSQMNSIIFTKNFFDSLISTDETYRDQFSSTDIQLDFDVVNKIYMLDD